MAKYFSQQFLSLNFLQYSIFLKKNTVSMGVLIKGVLVSVILCIFLLLYIRF